MKRAILFLAVLVALAAAAWRLRAPAPATGPAVQIELLPEAGDPGFARALAPREFVLPRDHGPHFEFQTEWWYYTGNLAAADGRRFGFQLTFFRRGLTPGPPATDDTLRSNQVYFAHFAVTDVAAGRHRFFERFARGAGGLAGASSEPFEVFLEDWSANGLSADGSTLRLRARDEDVQLDLRLQARKPLVTHGDRGLSLKSAALGNASFYVGYTRLAAQGTLAVGAGPAEVTGEAWFDHEWSTSALGAGAVGWDWFSLQLDDGRELMFFQIRRADGALEPVSGGTLVARDGSSRRLGLHDLRVEVLSTWQSPATGARYPAGWRLSLPGEALVLELAPLVADQELRASFTYWEGAVEVSGSAGGRPIGGRGYVELTGYARSMQGVF
jgi:predicted secreted hydrolase